MANDDYARRAMSLRITQLKFTQALKKDGCEEDSATQFSSYFDEVLERNTPRNVQACKDWVLKHIAPSRTRTALLGNYLVALSKSQGIDQNSASTKVHRSRLNLVLVVSDVLHAAKFHSQIPEHLFTELTTHIEELVELVASCLQEKDTKAENTLKAIIKYWHANELLPAETINSLIKRTRRTLRKAQGDAPPEPEKEVHSLPKWFGDGNAPGSETPMSYTLEPIVRHPGRPIVLSLTKSRELEHRQPSQRVCELLEEYLSSVDAAYEPTELTLKEARLSGLSFSSLGELTKQDNNGTVVIARGYGWSSKLCVDMDEQGILEDIAKARADYAVSRMEADGRGSGRHTHSSRSPKRRRYSSSGSEHDRRRRRRGRNSQSRSQSRSSYDSRNERSRSRGSGRDYRDLSRPSRSSDRNLEYETRRTNSHDHENEFTRGRPPPNPYPPRGPSQSNIPPNWQGHPNPNLSSTTRYNQHSVPPPPNYGGQYPPGPQSANIVPPPPPPPFSGQFPMPPFPPQFPTGSGVSMPGMPGMSGPPNFNASYQNTYPPPQIGSHPQNNFGGNQSYGGGFNQGGFQGGNFNQRGGFRGNNQRGRGDGSRWN